MGRVSFVAWLFVMSIASIVIAVGERSFGWFVGGLVLLFVAFYDSRR